MLSGLRMLDKLAVPGFCLGSAAKRSVHNYVSRTNFRAQLWIIGTNVHAKSAHRFHESYQLFSFSSGDIGLLQLIQASEDGSFWYRGLQLSLDARLDFFCTGF